ncbi:Gfo/Idh/MocA family protein [Streptomyces rhizosphaericus]|uniref:Gfo/Idh/MocA family protein n=1 Tax=Streptomyces rhizosphaericus TaxID=114699 RepID=UPI0020302884|nr:Gfo/Idh/MocA family oxidoreductase [Streptomyces rhizosphaericus]
MSSIRLAVIGCGAAARACHLPALPQVTGARLTALVDPDAAHAEGAFQVYREYGGSGSPHLATSWQDALGSFDAAVVAVPHTRHARLADDLLRHGKHVLMEKPMTTSPADAEMLLKTAADHPDTVLAMAHPRRLFPAYAWVHRLIRNGALGTVKRVHWTEGHPYSWEPVTWSMFDRRLAHGGVLTDTGSHVFDSLFWWLGTDIILMDHQDDSLGGLDSDSRTWLRFGTVDVIVELSRLRPLGTSCTITGTEAEVTIGTDFPAGECTLVTRSGEILHRGDVAPVAPARGEWEALFVEQLENFAAACGPRAVAPYSTAEDGKRVVDLIDACYHGPARRAAPQPWTVNRTRSAA